MPLYAALAFCCALWALRGVKVTRACRRREDMRVSATSALSPQIPRSGSFVPMSMIPSALAGTGRGGENRVCCRMGNSVIPNCACFFHPEQERVDSPLRLLFGPKIASVKEQGSSSANHSIPVDSAD
ncbi:hypothetical protein DL89DRAFT_263885, partial [Linderina pennispora]